MGDHLLATIIALERELQAQIQDEADRVRRWQDRQLAMLAGECRQCQEQLAAAAAAEVATARQAATAEQERCVGAAATWCARLAELAEKRGAAVLNSYLPMLLPVLPEVGDDHPDGQS